MKAWLKRMFAAVAVAGFAGGAQAQETVKIGFVGPYSGPFAMAGEAFRHGVQAYMALHGDTVAGKKVEIVYRDSGGADPSLAKRLAEELIVKDKVAMLAGFFLSPEAAAAAPVANAAKVPLFLVNAATPTLLKLSPYFVRVGDSINQPAELTAQHALESGKSRGFVAVGDYGPGHQVEAAFMSAFKAGGGQIVGNVRIPLNTTDFAPIAERIANENADVVQVFLPPGAASISFSKALAARGLTGKLMIVGQGEAEESELPRFDDSILGFKSVVYVDANADNPENAAFSDWLIKNAGPNYRGNTFNIGAFDSMHLIYKVLEDQKGRKFDGTAAVKSLAGYSFRSPRGPVTIDPATRELIQNFYLREVVKGEDGTKRNKVIRTWRQVKPTAAE